MINTVNQLKSCFVDFNISYAKSKEDVGMNQFYVSIWDVEPDIDYHLIVIQTIALFESFDDYIQFWTIEFEANLNKYFNIKRFYYDADTLELTVDLTIMPNKGRR